MFAIRDDRYISSLTLLSAQRGLSMPQRIYHPGRSHKGSAEGWGGEETRESVESLFTSFDLADILLT